LKMVPSLVLLERLAKKLLHRSSFTGRQPRRFF
jgi:hypothetical protein